MAGKRGIVRLPDGKDLKSEDEEEVMNLQDPISKTHPVKVFIGDQVRHFSNIACAEHTMRDSVRIGRKAEIFDSSKRISQTIGHPSIH